LTGMRLYYVVDKIVQERFLRPPHAFPLPLRTIAPIGSPFVQIREFRPAKLPSTPPTLFAP